MDREDRWSDIDLALCLAPDADQRQVVHDWTDRMYREHGALDHLDVWRGRTLFRVFLLASTLQVDLAFWSAAEFGATGPTFRLLFGTAHERTPTPPPTAAHLIGMARKHALHVRSSVARGRLWQAEYMLSVVRDQVLALMCLRHGLSTVEGRGLDDLPPEGAAPLTEALVRSLEPAELHRAFGVVMDALLREIELEDDVLAGRLAPTLKALMG
ncbi:nucleotidyltransferase domain-containing protein [Deinococcus petrolearius]|uniref:Nucleotidyltransferase domain-containing protein n=1 Tax=Deinococcus petrolearius TaxID=1751295 RepID=A0ABW1DLD7_9DEIO